METRYIKIREKDEQNKITLSICWEKVLSFIKRKHCVFGGWARVLNAMLCGLDSIL